METRPLGPNGPPLPLVGLGCNNFGWRIDRAATTRMIDRAIDLGGVHFDTADVYGNRKSEEFIGELLGRQRSRVFIATKFGKMPDAIPGLRGTRAYVRTAVKSNIEKGRLPTLERYGLGLIPYYPLGGGAHTGKYRQQAPLPEGARHAGGSARFLDPHWNEIEKPRTFAEGRGRSLLELAFSWLATRPQVVSIIAGARVLRPLCSRC